MKKIKFLKAVAAITAIAAMVPAIPVQAAKISMTGYTSSNALGVTLLVADSGVNISEVKPENIFWIDQQNINEDGSFTLTFPAFDATKYSVYTNAEEHIFGEAKTKTVYVSSSGTGNGETAESPASIDYAVKNIDFIKEIILLDNVIYSGDTLPANVTIKGNSADVTLTLAETVYLADALKLDNLKLVTASTIFANGYTFEVSDTVTSEGRLTVYGGASAREVASTNLILNGGLYTRVFAGGGNGGVVTGDTNVIFGGNANAGDGIDDDASNLSPCYVFGGGNGAAVGGKTNVTLEGNAVTRYLVGAGAGAGATDTNIYIKGGKVMNVYAGSTNAALPEGVNTHITMTGGMAEALFGGCESVSMTGNTFINLLGGEVTRRVFTGCYNNWSLSWKGTNHVTGNTTLVLTPEMANKLNTKNGLSSGNSSNVGVFAGSRVAENYADEHNTIIYLNDSYTALNGSIGDKSGYSWVFKNHADYTVKSGIGGTVEGTGNAGEIKIIPDEGKYANIDGGAKAYFANDTAAVSKTHSITFSDTFAASKTTTGVAASATLDDEKEGTLIAAVYDSTGNYVACNKVEYVPETDTYNMNIDCTLESGKTYTAKIFLWDSATGMSPLMNVYSITVK